MWTPDPSHPYMLAEHPAPKLLCCNSSLQSFGRSFQLILKHGCRKACPFSHNSMSKVVIFQVIPKVFSVVEFRALESNFTPTLRTHVFMDLIFISFKCLALWVPVKWNWNASAYKDNIYNYAIIPHMGVLVKRLHTFGYIMYYDWMSSSWNVLLIGFRFLTRFNYIRPYIAPFMLPSWHLLRHIIHAPTSILHCG